ncbi:MAG: tRNA (adenosine(37)-N6)-threonylcarbamoyltransferase complex dimerization subunit type 1 TsaB [Chitinophagaceae bacterium]|nr:tRNA (adenosine(37)-N6)-threonylcarbamoyltransferase complex dimerization subunit type 1 TsaB [Chitinophagaceae bacterium]
MPLILNIDTALETASVCLANNGTMIAFEESVEQKNHASFLQPAIQKMLLSSSININELDAIAVTSGPGSYTGLRVGLASAKGICYALEKPLITLNTLAVMAWVSKENILENGMSINSNTPMLFCPMIDARRMEVFTALYNLQLNEVFATTSMIITEDSFSSDLKNNILVFSGNGSYKLKNILKNQYALFADAQHNAASMITLSEEKFSLKSFANIAYSEPNYSKDFYNTTSKNNTLKKS